MRNRKAKPIGPMCTTRPRRENSQLPAFKALMIRHGFLDKHSSPSDAFGLWVGVCEDPVVRERSQKREARQRPRYLPSVAAGYAHSSRVIDAMKPKEIQQLKERLNIRPI
jgi:hypothetical protein